MSETLRPSLALLLAAALGGCRGELQRPERSVVIAAVGEPSALLPPVAYETVARDIGDLIFERLATLEPAAAPIDTSAYRPALASSWERIDPLRWRFRLRPGSRWHDGRPVTAADVVFSFQAYADSAVAAGAASYIAGRVTAVAENDSTVIVRFARPSPEQLYDATYHVRIIPRHIWDPIAAEAWAGDTTLARLVGSGPYRLREWRRGESLTLVSDTARGDSRAPSIRRVVWRFVPDPEAALNLVLAGEADLLESIGAPDRIARVEADSSLTVIRYPSAVYGFAGFRLESNPILADRAVRRALAMAVDRGAIAKNLYGTAAQVPNGPMSALLWVGYDSLIALPFSADSSAAALEAAGWRAGSDGVRRKGGRRLELEILVPSTSPARRQAAIAMQEMWRRIGVSAQVIAVEFPVFQERLAAGRFDVYIGAYLDEPSARGLADQWGSAGIGVLNHGGYRRPIFDSLLAEAGRAANAEIARTLYARALDTLNADAAAIFLYTPVQAAAVSRELEKVRINPYSWLSGLPDWAATGRR